MEIVYHFHDAPISARMKKSAEQAVRKAARRAARPLDAIIRFQQDGAVRRVDLVLHTSRGRRFVASSEARYFGSALADAARKLTMQLDHDKRSPKARARRAARPGAT